MRSLWVVQTCNLALDKEKQYLHQLLQKHNLVGGSYSVAGEYYKKQRLILRWHDEAVAELVSLCNQLAAHEKMVKDEIAQLQAVADTPVAKDADMLELLRQQLSDHYRDNPLSSQVEALNEHERDLHDEGRVVIKRTLENGIKIIFKLSQNKPPKVERRGRPRLKDRSEVAASKESSRGDLRVSRRLHEAQDRGSGAKVETLRVRTAKQRHNIDAANDRRVRTSARIHRDPPTVEGPVEIKPISKKAKPKTPVRQVTSKVVKPTGRKRGRPAKTDKSNQKVAPDNLPVPVFQGAQVQEEDTTLYCFCKQRSFGDMIACDNNNCPNGEWFHYKCVGLLNRVEALKYTTEKWYCSTSCREAVSPPKKRGRKKKARR